MSQTKAQLVGGVGISTVGDLSVYGGVNVTGVITATSFSGNATGITGTPNLNVGVVTATSFVGPLTGNATGLTGTPNITVGFITATGASISGNVSLGDSDKIILGDGGDLEIFHDSSNSVIKDVGTGNLVIAGDTAVDIYNSTITEVRARFLNNAAVELYYDNSKKFETSAAGAIVSGTLETQQLAVSGIVTASGFVDDGTNLLTEINTKTSTGKAIAMAMIFG